MNLKIYFIAALFPVAFFGQHGNVGINTNTPQATLDVAGEPSNTSKLDGIIAPRITGEQLRAKTYTNAQTGSLVYVSAPDTAPADQTVNVTAVGYYYFNGAAGISRWIPISFSDNDWLTTGNIGTTPGTNYLGTNDARQLMFKVNNTPSGFIDFENTRRNTAFGYNTLATGIVTTTNSANTAFGYEALSKLGTVAGSWQTQNVAVGDGAMKNLLGGAWNTAIGANAMGSATGDPNVLSSMRNNVALGISALAGLNNGSFNLAIGPNAMSMAKTVNPTDAISSNIAMGLIALDNLSNGVNNIALGFYAANSFLNGNNNVFIGSQPALNTTAGSQNVFIGHNAAGSTSTSSNEINIGNVIKGTGSDNSSAPSVSKKIGINLGSGLTPNSTLQVNGSVSSKIRVLNSGTIAADDYTVLVQGNLAMPAADANNAGRIYHIVNDTWGNITVSGTFRINGSNFSNYGLNNTDNGRGVTVQSTGSAWA